MYMSPDEFPLPYEYRDMVFEGIIGAPPDDLNERTIVFLDCGNIDRMPVDFLKGDGLHILNIDHHHDNTRFGTVNLVDATASCTAEIVWRLVQGAGRRADAGHRRRHVRRAGHRHRALLLREHLARLPPDGGRADGGRREPPPGLPPPVRGPSLPPAAAAPARPGQRPAPRRRRDDAGLADPRGLRRHRRPGDRLRGHRRPHARGRGHRRGGAGARAAGPGPPGTAQGEPARHRRPRGRVPHRPVPERRRAPAGSRLHHRACRWTSWWSASGTRSPTSSERRPGSSQARGRHLTRRRGLDSPVASARHAGGPRRDAGSLRHRRAAGAGGPRHPGPAVADGLPKTYRAVARLGWASDTGDRDGELVETGRVPASLDIPVGPSHAGSAGVLGRPGGRRARLRPRAAR